MTVVNITEHLTNDIRGVAGTLVREVVEIVESLYSLQTETPEHHKDGVGVEISMELHRLHFDNEKLDMPVMPDEGLTLLIQAVAKKLWAEEVNRLLDLHADQNPEYPINFRL